MLPKIYLAFRFHGNFYHSYRGDTPDELGFGKDIRIIRHAIQTLDELNAQGIAVCGTWDFENLFSLEKIMPAHCPDIVTSLQRRARDNHDEMHLMSYNNGLISAHTPMEFGEAIRRGISNSAGSGLLDLFGDSFFNMVRPQEMMYTPAHLKLYPANGITAISLYYSALPFNGFSNFIPPLTLPERYNPLTLSYPGIEETLTLMPCYSHGDIADHLTLRRWIRAMRKQQLTLDTPQDLLLLIDMDADDDFWMGFKVPLLYGRFSTISGLKGIVESVTDLGYVCFTTPGRYLNDHKPLKRIVIRQDTADGSFDGYSSWAEKWSNQRLWTGLERARILELQTRRLLANNLPIEINTLLNESFEARLRILSTTHFGLAAPVMNLAREQMASTLVQRAVESAATAFLGASPAIPSGTFSLMDYPRGVSTNQIQVPAHPSRALVRLILRESAPNSLALTSSTGQALSTAVIKNGEQRELFFVEHFEPSERKDFVIEEADPVPSESVQGHVEEHSLQNEFIQLNFDRQGQVCSVKFNTVEIADGRFMQSGITYANRQYHVETWTTHESHSTGFINLKRMLGTIQLQGRETVRFAREILLAAGLPYIYVRMRIEYPFTPNFRYDRGKAKRLQQGWDSRWKEIMPCEIRPALIGETASPLRVWKHNYCHHVSSYSLNYGSYSKNYDLDSANNHITNGWVAVSNGSQGILVAQTADALSSMAFCPVRTRRKNDQSQIFLNPFGTYSGRQYNYLTADTGLGKWLTTAFSAGDHIQPYAPSYNGRVQEFSILLAPYSGDAPPEETRHDAEAFAYPYLLLNDDQVINTPAHRRWDGGGLGIKPGR